jgi:hypothetical protein
LLREQAIRRSDMAWVHMRQAGALLVVGLAIGAVLPAL